MGEDTQSDQVRSLVNGSSLSRCLLCQSPRLRPLILLAREGIPPGEPGHNIVYSHDAIFGCDDCHAGYTEVRRHDCFDFEEIYDQDDHHPLDAESIGQLLGCLPNCPTPLSEKCDCKVHQSLRSTWHSLPNNWDNVKSELPRPILRMADADQKKRVVPRVMIRVADGEPRLVAASGKR